MCTNYQYGRRREIMKKIIKWLKDNLDRDLYEYYGVKKGERI